MYHKARLLFLQNLWERILIRHENYGFNCTFEIIFAHSVRIKLILYFQQYLAQVFNKWLLNWKKKKVLQPNYGQDTTFIYLLLTYIRGWVIVPLWMGGGGGITSSKPLDRCSSRFLFHVSDWFPRVKRMFSRSLPMNFSKWIATINCIWWKI